MEVLAEGMATAFSAMPPYNMSNDVTNYTDVTNVTDTEDALLEMNRDMYNAVLPITIFVGIEAGVGFLGNAVVLYVFLFRYKPCNFRYFVLCLAFTDILSTLTTIPGEVVTQVNWYIYPNKQLCKVKSFFNVFTVSGEALCLLTIAVDRYRKVCNPHKWQIQPHVAKRLCFINYLLALMIALPVAFFWGLRSQEQIYNYRGRDVTVTTKICEKDEDFEDTGWPLAYSITVTVIVSVCLVAMFCLYVFVARRLLKNTMLKRRASRMHATMNNSASAGSLTYSEQGEFETAKVSELPSSNDKMTEIEPSLLHSGKWCNDKETRPNSGSSAADSFDDESKDEVEKNQCASSGHRSDDQDNGVCLSEVETKMDGARNVVTEPTSPAKTEISIVEVKRKCKKDINKRVRRKTLIMFILTVIFILTTATYLTLLSFIAKTDDILQYMSDSSRAVYFFFFRLVFINHVINPIVYGLLDPQFRNSMKRFRPSKMCVRKY